MTDKHQDPGPNEAAAKALCEAMDDDWYWANMPGGKAPRYRRLVDVVISADREEKGLVTLHDLLQDHPQAVQVDYEDAYPDESGDEGDVPIAVAYYRVWWKEERPDWLDEEEEYE